MTEELGPDELQEAKSDLFTYVLLEKVKAQLCRVCGMKKEVLFPIFSEISPDEDACLLSTKIEMYLPLKICCNGTLPLNICEKCQYMVESWHELHVSCLAADSVLRKMFENEASELPIVGEEKEDDIFIQKGLKKEITPNEGDLENSAYDSCDFLESKSICEENLPVMDNLEIVQDDLELRENAEERNIFHDHLYIKSKADKVRYKNTSKQFAIHPTSGQIKRCSTPEPAPGMGKMFMYRCNFCGDAFPEKYALDLHLTQYAVEETVCDLCGKVLDHRCQLKAHLMYHKLRNKTYTCQKCGKKLSSSQALKDHIKTRHGAEEDPKLCEPCCKIFTNECVFKKHVQFHEKSMIKGLNFRILPLQEEGGPARYKCPVCGNSFEDKVSLVVHMNAPWKKKCAKCKMWFLSEKQLFFHKCRPQRRHWICPYCGKQFKARSYMVVHERLHTGTKPFLCTVCGLIYPSLNALKNHQVSHKPPSLQCPLCDKMFKHKRTYQDHLQSHSGKQLECKHCKKKFVFKKSLVRHIKILHDDI